MKEKEVAEVGDIVFILFDSESSSYHKYAEVTSVNTFNEVSTKTLDNGVKNRWAKRSSYRIVTN